jgi:hypothetical protein
VSDFQSEIDKLWESFDKLYPGGAGELDKVGEKISVEGFLNILTDSLSASLESGVAVLSALLGISVITVVLSYLSFDERRARIMEISSLTVFSFIVFSFVSPIITMVEGSLSSLLDFTSSLSPILSSILLSFGCVNGAGVQALSMNLISSLISFSVKNLLLPLSFSVFAFAIAASVSEKGAPRVLKGIKGVFFSLFGILSTVLFSSLSLQSMISSASDSLYIKTAKQAISRLVPVVGSTISASLSSLYAAFGLLRGGVFGMSLVFVLSLFLPGFFSILFLRFAFSLSVSFMDFCENTGGVRLFSSFIFGIDTLLSLYVLSFLSVFFGLFFFLKGGGAALG